MGGTVFGCQCCVIISLSIGPRRVVGFRRGALGAYAWGALRGAMQSLLAMEQRWPEHAALSTEQRALARDVVASTEVSALGRVVCEHLLSQHVEAQGGEYSRDGEGSDSEMQGVRPGQEPAMASPVPSTATLDELETLAERARALLSERGIQLDAPAAAVGSTMSATLETGASARRSP